MHPIELLSGMRTLDTIIPFGRADTRLCAAENEEDWLYVLSSTHHRFGYLSWDIGQNQHLTDVKTIRKTSTLVQENCQQNGGRCPIYQYDRSWASYIIFFS